MIAQSKIEMTSKVPEKVVFAEIAPLEASRSGGLLDVVLFPAIAIAAIAFAAYELIP